MKPIPGRPDLSVVTQADAVDWVPLDRLKPAAVNDVVYKPVSLSDPAIVALGDDVAEKGTLLQPIDATYPDGYVLTRNYSGGSNGSISRLSSLSDTTGTLESYEYLGLGTVVTRAHPQPNVDLTYVKRSGESNGAAGDQYTGLDLFGRVIDQRWLNPSTGTATDRFQYGYDILGNRLYRDNLVNAAFGELYGYDDMSQLVSFDRGTLNGPKTGLTGAASRTQGWDQGSRTIFACDSLQDCQ